MSLTLKIAMLNVASSNIFKSFGWLLTNWKLSTFDKLIAFQEAKWCYEVSCCWSQIESFSSFIRLRIFFGKRNGRDGTLEWKSDLEGGLKNIIFYLIYVHKIYSFIIRMAFIDLVLLFIVNFKQILYHGVYIFLFIFIDRVLSGVAHYQ